MDVKGRVEAVLKIVSSVREVGEAAWRALESPDFPFLDFAFLAALEDSRSIGRGTGWQSCHLVYEEQGVVLGALPAYIKQHSYGEYIFDWQWANFYQANGADYYPKLLTAVPFTPATGPRLLVRAEAPREKIQAALIQGSLSLAREHGMSSYHALFVEESEREIFADQGMTLRHSLQYHWKNQGYRDFADFLDSFVGKRRRDIQRERTRANSHGLTIQRLTGSDLESRHADIMTSFYQATSEKKDAIAYLRDEFFSQIFAEMPERVLFVLASRGDKPVAGALNFVKGRKLYGRYWGSSEALADLHFELCYYQTIEFALERGLELFEAGAQGEHKVQRGFLPALTFSAHKIFDLRFARPIDAFIHQERAALEELISQYSNPFRSLPDASRSR